MDKIPAKNAAIQDLQSELGKRNPDPLAIRAKALAAAKAELEIVFDLFAEDNEIDSLPNILSAFSCIVQALPADAQARIKRVLPEIY
jgi:hypothetical protein